MSILNEWNSLQTRRRFLGQGANALGAAALTSLLGRSLAHAAPGAISTQHLPKAKRVIYLHMVGGPAQMDLFDYKPEMQAMFDKDLPASIRNGQRLTTMTSGQTRFPVAPSKFKFSQAGKCGLWMNTELLPNLAKNADDICWMRSLNTEAINHEPAICAMQTGNQITGRPCLGSWASYGLGSANDNLPSFVVLIATPTNRDQEQAISSRLWSSGYLPGEHAGVSFRSKGDPILFINNPPGVPQDLRKQTIDGINQLNRLNYETLIATKASRVREAAGEAYLLFCGAPVLASLGLADGLRVGPDVAPYWDNEERSFWLADPTGPGLRNALRSTLHRLWLMENVHVDPDVVYFRTRFNLLSPEEMRLQEALAHFTGFKATSDPPSWLLPEEKGRLEAFLAREVPVRRLGPYRFRVGEEEVDYAPLL